MAYSPDGRLGTGGDVRVALPRSRHWSPQRVPGRVADELHAVAGAHRRTSRCCTPARSSSSPARATARGDVQRRHASRPASGTRRPSTFQSVATPWDAFCSGHAFLPDGELLVAGGNTAYPGPATNNANAGLDEDATCSTPTRASTQAQPDMAVGPLVPDGGRARQRQPLHGRRPRRRSASAPTPARSSTAPAWSAPKAPPAELNFMPMYPALHLLDGRPALLLGRRTCSGAGRRSPGSGTSTTNAWQTVPGLTDAGPPRPVDERAAAAGAGPEGHDHGRRAPGPAGRRGRARPRSSTSSSRPRPTSPGPAMDTKKMYVSAVILPDSTVFETGGASTTIHNGNKPVFSAQIFDPKTSTWTKAATPTRPPRRTTPPRCCSPTAGSRPSAATPRTASRCGSRSSRRRTCRAGTPRPTITSAPTEIDLRRRPTRSARRRPRRCAPRCSCAPRPSRHSSDPQPAPRRPAVHRTASGVDGARCRRTGTSRRRAGTCSSSSTATASRRSRSGSTSRLRRAADVDVSAASGSAAGSRSPRWLRVRTISTSASPARNRIAIQPSVRTCQKNVGHSNVGGQVACALLRRDVRAAPGERDRRQQAEHAAPARAAAAPAAPPPRPARPTHGVTNSRADDRARAAS